MGQLKIQRGAVIETATIQMAVSVSGSTISLNNKDLNGFTFAPNIASAAIRLLPDGTMQTRASHSTAPFGAVSNEWGAPRQNLLGVDYEARLSKISGGNPAGDLLGAWLPLNQTRTWDLQSTGFAEFQGTLDIRQNGTILDSATIDLTAFSEGTSQ